VEREVRALAEARGVTVATGRGECFEVLLEAPTGCRYEPGLHELVVAGYREDAPRVVWALALGRLRAAEVERCDDAACEWCGESEHEFSPSAGRRS
jgi:hypothetical protein